MLNNYSYLEETTYLKIELLTKANIDLYITGLQMDKSGVVEILKKNIRNQN